MTEVERIIAQTLFTSTYGGTSDPDLTQMAEELANAQASAVVRDLTAAGYATVPLTNSTYQLIKRLRAQLDDTWPTCPVSVADLRELLDLAAASDARATAMENFIKDMAARAGSRAINLGEP